MNRDSKIDNFLQSKLSNKYWNFWQTFTSDFNLPYEKASSSSGKYHLNTAGKGHSVGEHTYEMLVAAESVLSLFGDSKQDQNYDIILLGIALHDIHKYGIRNTRDHTTSDHGHITAQEIERKGMALGLNNREVTLLAEIIRWHDGRWSSVNPGRKPIEFTAATLFVHMLDMLSSRRCLRCG